MAHRWFSDITQRALHWGAWAVVVLSVLGSLAPVPADARPAMVAPADGHLPAEAPAPRAVPVTWHEALIDTPDGRLAFAKAGRGPLLVVVPGGPGAGGDSLRQAFAPLTREATVVLLDPIGRGRSSRLADPRRYTVARDAEDIEQVRLHFGVRQIAVYGHSYGGLVAQRYALDHPQQVRRLVLGNTLHGARAWQTWIDTLTAEARRQRAPGWQRSMAWQAGPGAAAAGQGGFNAEVYRAMLGDEPEWRIGGTLREVELLGQLGWVQAPTLVLTGRHDRIGSPPVAEAMARALRAAPASLRIFETSAHQPFVEEPEAWAAEVAAFLR